MTKDINLTEDQFMELWKLAASKGDCCACAKDEWLRLSKQDKQEDPNPMPEINQNDLIVFLDVVTGIPKMRRALYETGDFVCYYPEEPQETRAILKELLLAISSCKKSIIWEKK